MQQNQSRDEILAASLTAESTELLPYLPYLLQDIWELGGDIDETTALLKGRLPAGTLRVLDLACGKGAQSIGLAKAFGWRVKGVDLLPAFVAEARQKAGEHGVEELCTFEVGDAVAAAEAERDYDLVLFVAAGNVLGPPPQMLARLAQTVRPGGHVVLGESMLPEDFAGGIKYQNYEMYPGSRWRQMFADAGLAEVARLEGEETEMSDKNDTDLAAITRRAGELAAKHPEKAALFQGYVQSQQNEVDDIENSFINLVWLLQKKG